MPGKRRVKPTKISLDVTSAVREFVTFDKRKYKRKFRSPAELIEYLASKHNVSESAIRRKLKQTGK